MASCQRTSNAGFAALSIALVAAFTGCSGGRELRTQGQAGGFVAQVAGGESPGEWKLASKPTSVAVQAWSNRAEIENLGQILRSKGSSTACELAHKSIGLGLIGSFNANDASIIAREATELGVEPRQISAMLHDITTLHFRELVLATTAICGPYFNP